MGGQLAASTLIQELNSLGRRMTTYAIVCVNRAGLAGVLRSNGIISNKSEFDDFITGFNQASPLLSIIDVGSGKEAADAKLRGNVLAVSLLISMSNHQTFPEMLRLFANIPQVKRIYFGGKRSGNLDFCMSPNSVLLQAAMTPDTPVHCILYKRRVSSIKYTFWMAIHSDLPK